MNPDKAFLFYMNIGIYKIYWTNCKYVYIGQSVYLNRRKRQHLNQLKTNSHRNNILQNIYKKYGEPLFEIVDTCYIYELTTKEQYWIDFYKGAFSCNIPPTANSPLGIKRSDETKLKLRLANLGSVKSPELRKILSDKAKERTPESRVNCGTKKGIRFSAETNLKKSVSGRLAVTDEKRNRDRENMIKRNLIGAKNPSAKLVFDTATGIYYDTLKEASIGHKYNYAYLKTMVGGSSRNKTNFIYA